MVSKFAPLHIEICKTLRTQLQYIFVWNDELEKFSSTFYLTLIHNFRHHFGVSIIFKFLKSSSTSSTALDCFPGFLYSSKCDSRFLDVCMRTTTVCVRACVVFFSKKNAQQQGRRRHLPNSTEFLVEKKFLHEARKKSVWASTALEMVWGVKRRIKGIRAVPWTRPYWLRGQDYFSTQKFFFEKRKVPHYLQGGEYERVNTLNV